MNQRIDRRKKPPDDIIVHALCSLNGEISHNIRMVGFGYSVTSAIFRYFMEDEPTEDDRERAEIVAVNFDSGHMPPLKRLDIEFVVTNTPFGKLAPLDFVLFRRHEEYDA